MYGRERSGWIDYGKGFFAVALGGLVLLISLSGGRCGGAEEAPPWHVWVETATVRLLRDAEPGGLHEADLAAARNEWVGFQIFLRSAQPAGGVRVEPGDLRGPGGAVLRAVAARIYREHQLRITTPTPRNRDFRPGWYPDPLIPNRHPLTREPLRGGRYRAMPFDLPAGETHGFWVDIHVPPETPAGEYRGAYRVTSADGRTAVIPVRLTVWDFELPAVPALKTAFGSPAARMRSYYRERARAGKEAEPEDWEAVERQCAELVSRHKINATPPGELLRPAERDGSWTFSAGQVEALRAFADRYKLNAIRVPHPSSVVEDPERGKARLHAWLSAWDRLAAALERPDIVFYTYLKDEPNDPEAYRYVRRWGRAIREARSAVKVLVVEQTWPQDPAWGDLYGAVDIWCPLFSLFRPESAARRQALGETIWTYTALCQLEPTPWWHIDQPLLNYRVPAWIAWRYRIRGLLYWGGMSYWRQVEDPWTDACTYRPRGGERPCYHGEGTLVYPGRAVGYEGIAPSLRLKALRDAIEDYEYLAILERQGRAKEAEAVIRPLAESWFHWERDPAAYEKARRELARLITAKRAR